VSNFTTLLKKDLQLEFRRKETIVAMASLAILLSVVVSFGLSAAFLDPASTVKIFAPLAWILFLFWSTLTVGRTIEYEFETASMDGILLTRAAPEAVYLAKVVHNFALITLVQILTVVLLGFWLSVEARILSPDFLLIISLGSAAYTPLATLLAALTATARLKSLLLPLILLPLFIPALFAAIELSTQLLLTGQVAWFGFWGGLLAMLPLMYIVLGAALFRFTVR